MLSSSFSFLIILTTSLYKLFSFSKLFFRILYISANRSSTIYFNLALSITNPHLKNNPRLTSTKHFHSHHRLISHLLINFYIFHSITFTPQNKNSQHKTISYLTLGVLYLLLFVFIHQFTSCFSKCSHSSSGIPAAFSVSSTVR